MKKTMITLAAMFAATVTMAAVTSQVVGYQTKATGAGFTPLCPNFTQVGGGDLTLADLHGSFVEFESIQFVDSGAATAVELFYLEEGSAASGVTGWYADDFSTYMGDTVIPFGTSILYSGGDVGTIVFSGAVCPDTIEIATQSDFNMVGNPYPVDLMLSQISFVGVAEFESVQFVTSDFATASEFFYLEAGSASPDITGWYADDFSTYAGDTVVAAGQGFLFNSSSGSGAVITISSPL